MKFDSSRAWQEAVSAFQANREVLLTVAGVFFLLPGLVSAIFLSDIQENMLASLGNPAAVERAMQGQLGTVMGFGLVSFVLQTIGYLAMLALLTDRTRPTVAQAIAIAVSSLPTLIGAMLLLIVGYASATVAYVLLASLIGAATGLKALVAVLVVLLIVLVVGAMVRLSLLLPVIAIDKVLNPFTVLTRSWQLTRNNGLRLFVFYFLLFLIYLAVILVVGIGVMSVATLAAGTGMVSKFIGGLVSGLIGAVASAILTAILAAVHRQLGAQPSAGSSFQPQ